MSIKDPAYKENTMRNHIHYLLLFVMIGAVMAAASAAEPQGKNAAGTLQGRVLFEGGKARPGTVVTDAVVYLMGNGLATKGAVTKDDAAVAILNQQDLTFVPHVLPVLEGTKVQIRNNDNVMHNIHTTSKKNPAFNRAQLRKTTMHVVFEVPEIIHVGCDVHSQMSAYILVLPNPFFARVGKDGAYTISGVSPGKYELVGWHEKYGTVTTNVEIGAGKTIQADVSFSKISGAQKAAK